MKKNRRHRRRQHHAAAAPTNVEVPAIGIDICPLNFPDGQRWLFNLEIARTLTKLPPNRPTHWLDHDELGRLIEGQVAGKTFAREKIDAQDPRVPGIGVVIDYGGQRRLNLIDGLERAVKAFVTRSGFALYVLSDVERDRALWSKTGLAGFAERILKGDA